VGKGCVGILVGSFALAHGALRRRMLRQETGSR
jgi:hypothetical protein